MDPPQRSPSDDLSYFPGLAEARDQVVLGSTLPEYLRLRARAGVWQVGTPGSLEVVCGPMFSGKSEELMRRLRRAAIAAPGRGAVVAFKHGLDDRHGASAVRSHDGTEFVARPTADLAEILACACRAECTVVGVDEAQFFPDGLVAVVCELVRCGKKVVVAGLDMDFRGLPFGPMPTLMAIADTATKLSAVCTACGRDAVLTQRLVGGHPAAFDDPIVQVGDDEYQARCRACHKCGPRAK